jgi:cytochrome c biogenesis protein
MLSKLNKFFSSIKLAIILFILIAAISIIGTVIDQGDTLAQYKIIYGDTVFHILYWLGFLNIYSSWYFIGLAVLLILTMITASANKLPKVIKNIIEPYTSFDNALKKNSYKAKYTTIQSSKSPSEILNIAEKTFAKKFGKPVLKNLDGNAGKNAVHNKNSSGNFLFFSKNSIFRISPNIAHFGVIVVLTGVFLGVALGYRSYTNIKVGQTVQHSYLLKNNNPVLLPFKIKLDNYATKYYKNGMPKAYISTLTIIKKHIAILTKSIRVNHPLTYDGITIYQASYGHYKPNAAQILVLNLKNKNKNNKRLIYAVPGKLYNSKISNIKFSFNFFKNPAKNQIPFYISIIKNNKTVTRPIVFQELPYRTKKGNMPLFFAKYNNNIAFVFAGIKTYYYSGVEITKNVDTYIVWIGSAILIFALFFSFFFNQKSLWIRVIPSEEKEKTNKIELLSVPNKKFASFYSMIDRLTEIFKKQI